MKVSGLNFGNLLIRSFPLSWQVLLSNLNNSQQLLLIISHSIFKNAIDLGRISETNRLHKLNNIFMFLSPDFFGNHLSHMMIIKFVIVFHHFINVWIQFLKDLLVLFFTFTRAQEFVYTLFFVLDVIYTLFFQKVLTAATI